MNNPLLIIESLRNDKREKKGKLEWERDFWDRDAIRILQKEGFALSPKCNGEESFLGLVILWWRNFSLDPPIMTIFWSLRISHIAIKIIAFLFSPTPRTAPNCRETDEYETHSYGRLAGKWNPSKGDVGRIFYSVVRVIHPPISSSKSV